MCVHNLQVLTLRMTILLLILVLSFPTAIVLYAGYIYYVRNIKYGHIPRITPKSYFLGHAELFREEAKTGKYRAYKWLEWTDSIGPTFCLFILHGVMIVTGDPVIIKEVLMHNKYEKSKTTYTRISKIFGERFIGTGLVSQTDHATWMKRRAVFNPAFHRKSLMDYMDDFNDGADKFMVKLEEYADGFTKVCVSEIVGRLTLDIIGKVAFSMDINSLDEPENRFPVVISTCLKSLMTDLKNPFMKLNPFKWKTIEEKRNIVKELRRFGRNCFEKRIKVIEEGKHIPNDILTGILSQFNTDDDLLTLDDLIDDFVTFFIAGQETTGNAVLFTLMMLAQHPEIKERVIDEIDSVLGDRKRLEYSDIGKLEYLDQVWKETLRLYPTAPGTIRDVHIDTKIGDLLIPANTPVMVQFFLTHRYPGNYTNPEEFQPERFADGQTHGFKYLPFSLGMRSCIGSHFAWIEGKTILARFLQTYTYDLVPGQDPHGLREYLTLKPADGVICTLKKRF